MRVTADDLRRSAALFAILILFGNSTASADTFWWIALGSGEWSDGRNWVKTAGSSDRKFPNHETDDAIITENNTAEITQEVAGGCMTVGDLCIENGGCVTIDGTCLVITGKLKIAPNGKLKIKNGGEVKLTGGERHRIHGAIELAVTGGGTVTIESKDSKFVGSGKITGRSGGAVIEIAGGQTLTSNIVIRGVLTIRPVTGTATFDNRKDVIANAAGNLVLGTNLTLSDDSTANWQAVTNGSATLQFKQAAASLAGDFECDSNGVLDFDATVTTTGCLTQPSGVDCVDASASGVCFNWCGGGNDCNGTS